MSHNNRWSVRTATGKKGSYAIVSGIAYDQVVAGQNTTKQVTTDIRDRESFYRDPAVKLSEYDLDDIDGAIGAPLCVQHKKNDVVGFVSHSWLNNGNTLKITGRIPIKDADGNDIPRGQQIVADIKCGKLKGFSVGYRNDIKNNSLHAKIFDEISLVDEPFFENCLLSTAVMASKSDEGILMKQINQLT